MQAPVLEGLRDLGRARLATTTAGVAALAAALALQAALRSGVRASSLAELLGLVLVGAALSSLLGSCARSLALTAYSQPGRPWLAGGFARVPALVTVTAVELTVEGSLLFGTVLLLPRAVAARSALAGVLVCAPSLILGAVMFGAARVALVLAARGLPPARALVHGFDVVLRRLPSLVRLAFALAVYTLPLTLVAATLLAASLLPITPPATALARALSLALVELAALWGYAALANLVGRDPRLVSG